MLEKTQVESLSLPKELRPEINMFNLVYCCQSELE